MIAIHDEMIARFDLRPLGLARETRKRKQGVIGMNSLKRYAARPDLDDQIVRTAGA